MSEPHGGKARGLRALSEHGLPVPDAIGLTTDDIEALLGGDEGARNELLALIGEWNAGVAVRSSAMDEDGQSQSFAGMFKSVLDVEPRQRELFDAIGEVSESGDADRVRSYSGAGVQRIPVVVQRMVDATYSGVLFTRATSTTGEECFYAEWVEGLGESLVSGRTTPGAFQCRWQSRGELKVSSFTGYREPPNASLVSAVCALAVSLERLSSDHGWDAEFALDADGKLWALQMRPITKPVLVPSEQYVGGALGVSPGTATGPVRFVDDESHNQLLEGDVLVAEITEVDYLPAMRRAAAIVTEEGGLLSHAAIVARELEKPCVVGAKGAMTRLVEGESATVDGSRGQVVSRETMLGGDSASEVDWRSVYLYDRGIDLAVSGGVSAYFEQTIDGLIAFVDEGSSIDAQAEVERVAREYFGLSAAVVESDWRVWYAEWKRFNQLRTVQLVHSQFAASIARWDARVVRKTIERFFDVVKLISGLPESTALQQLYRGEIGAALHASIAVEVEGYALWAAYKDTASFRFSNKKSFGDVVAGRGLDSAPSEIQGISECLGVLGALRNDGFNFFRAQKAFDGNYFSGRSDLVRRAAEDLAIPNTEEGSALDALYRLSAYIDQDDRFAVQAAGVLIGS